MTALLTTPLVMAVLLAQLPGPATGGALERPRAADEKALAAETLIVAALRARLGRPDAEVTVEAIDGRVDRRATFKSVRLDPAAVLGRPMRATLMPAAGGPGLTVSVSVQVVATHVLAGREVPRTHTLTADDVVVQRAVLTGIPLRRLPVLDEVIGARALRPIAAGAVVLPGAVVLRRLVEPGDSVTAIARVGEAEVSAVMVAADGGESGDVIRVSHPDTRKAIRARVVRSGVVEVIHAR